jgi:TonB family protein
VTAAIDAVVRSSVLLAAALAVRGVLARRSAALRYGVLAGGRAAAILVVPASLVVPSWTLPLPSPTSRSAPPAPAPAPDVPISAAGQAAAAKHARPGPPPIVTLWFVGFLLAAGTLAAGLGRLVWTAATARPFADEQWRRQAETIAAAFGLRQKVVLLETAALFPVATWGMRPPRVMLPPQARRWSEERIHAVLVHELAHVARGDWPMQIAARVFASVVWFNPLAWITCRLLRHDSESACDDAVLADGVPAPDYAAHLVALARECRRSRWQPVPALFIAHPSVFERRIAAMLNAQVDRRPVSRRAAAAVAAVLLAVMLPAAAVRAVQAPPSALSGTVYDPTGAVMPGVTITLEDPQHHTAQAMTGRDGRFSFPGIGSGQYVLSAEIPGFRKLRDEFELKTAADWDRAVTLQIGTVQETISVRASRVAAPPPATATPVPIRVGGNIRRPAKTLDVRPVYPASMRAAGREGQVQIDAIIGTDGTVSSVRVLSAQVHPDFAIAAADAVRQWRFTPTLLNSQPVEVVMTVTVRFSLSD